MRLAQQIGLKIEPRCLAALAVPANKQSSPNTHRTVLALFHSPTALARS